MDKLRSDLESEIDDLEMRKLALQRLIQNRKAELSLVQDSMELLTKVASAI